MKTMNFDFEKFSDVNAKKHVFKCAFALLPVCHLYVNKTIECSIYSIKQFQMKQRKSKNFSTIIQSAN